MDNVQIIINNIEVTDFEPSQLGLATTWQSKLISEVNSFKVKGTKTITLPVTRQLNEALGNPLVVDSISELNPTAKPEISILVNGELIIYGYMKISRGSIYQVGGSIEFTVKPKEKDWIDSLKDLNMQDIDLSAHTHDLNYDEIFQNITNSGGDIWRYAPIDIGWMGYRSILFMEQTVSGSVVTTTIYFSGGNVVAFPSTETVTIVGCKDTSLNIECDISSYVDSTWNAVDIGKVKTTDLPEVDFPEEQAGYFKYEASYVKFMVHDYAPCIPLTSILEQAFTDIGWSLSYDTSIISDYFHFMYNEEDRKRALDKRLRYAVGIKDGDWTLTGVTGQIDVPFTKENRVGFYNQSDYDDTDSDDLPSIVAGTHTSEWTAPEECFMTFRGDIEFYGNATNIELAVWDNAGSTKYLSIDSQTLTSGDNEYKIALKGGAHIPATYKVKVTITFTGSSFTPVILDKSTLVGSPVYKMMPNMQVHLSDFLPNTSTYNWFKDLAILFQLRFYTNEQLKTIYIVKDVDNMSGVVNDWSDKLDRSQDVEISPVSLLHPLQYRVDYLSDGNDVTMLEKEEISGRYAGGEVDNTHAFAESVEQVDLTVYSATLNGHVDYYTPFRLGIPYMNGADGSRVNYNARLFKVENESTPTQYVEGSLQSQLYDIGDFSTSVTAGTFPRATFPTELYLSALISTHWSRFVNTLKYGHVLRGVFEFNEQDAGRLNVINADQNDFRAWHNITVNGVDIRCELLKVIDYQPTAKTKTIIELIWMKRN